MKIKLFCFPFAGASANTFFKWKSHLNPGIELIAVEYPGRGSRFDEPLCSSLASLLEELYPQILTNINNAPFAFYGHSFGVLIAYAIAVKMQQQKRVLPKKLIFSGHVAPQYTKNQKRIYHLPDELFINEIINLGGVSREIFESADLCEIFLPILRADVTAAETYQVANDNVKLDTDIEFFYSKDDQLLCEEGVMAWEECTNRAYTITPFEGHHMFLLSQEKEICDQIKRILSASTK